MRPRVLLLSLLACALLPGSPGRACVSMSGDDLKEIQHRKAGGAGEKEDFVSQFKPNQYVYPEYLEGWPSADDWKKLLATLEKKLAADPHPPANLRNDHAAALVYNGRAAEALPIFLQLVGEGNGVYSYAANLGTTYELTGQDGLALYWIQAALKRNPQSHEGTEWLHVKILETKLALAHDPHWLETHSVLDLDFGHKAKPDRPATLTEGEAGKAILALHYQLHERMGFVKPPDAVVGDLLFDLANLAALDGWPQQAVDLYQAAINYHAPRSALAAERRDHYSWKVTRDKMDEVQSAVARSPLNWLVVLGLLIVGVRRVFYS